MKSSHWLALAVCFTFGVMAFAQQGRPGGAASPASKALSAASNAASTTSTTASTTSTSSTGSAVSPDAALQQNLQEILEEPASPDAYRYDPQGRRDPFRSLIGPAQKVSRENAPQGPPGFLIDEMKLMGIVKARQGLSAMVKGPDNNGYLVHVGDKVFDGEIIRITPTSIVFRQEVNDPTRIERYREVVKELAPQGSKSGKK
jgi:Tfp pilus assembly protein PilP